MSRLGRASLFALCGSALVLGASAGCSDSANVPQVSLGGTGGAAGTSSGGSPSSGSSSSGSSSGGTPNGGSSVVTAGSGGTGSPGGSGGSGGGAGSAGSAGSGGSANSGGSAGSGGTAGGTGGTPGCTILPVVAPVIYEFPESAGDGGAGGADSVSPIESFSFGYNANPPTVFSGYSFVYPDTLESDISQGNWHVSGSVGTYAGFQIGFVCSADASNYKGISFKISGNAGPTGSLSFAVAHATNVWRNPAGTESTAAKCMAANQYDGTCQDAAATVPVTGTQTTVSLLWEDIENGKPEMNPDPTELMALRWLFPWDAASDEYDVNVRLDDLTFIQE
jgi:hypothetical protein